MKERLFTVREEVEKYGVDSINTIELISDLVGLESKKFNQLVEEFGTIKRACLSASISQTVRVTPARVYKLELLGEILKRNVSASAKKKSLVGSPEVISDLYMQEMRSYEVEHFDVLILNTKNEIIKKTNISKGTLNASIAHPREIFKEAIRNNANSVILIHNHPSGDPRPSPEDIRITERIIQAGVIIGIRVLDHIVFGDNKYISFKREGIVF